MHEYILKQWAQSKSDHNLSNTKTTSLFANCANKSYFCIINPFGQSAALLSFTILSTTGRHYVDSWAELYIQIYTFCWRLFLRFQTQYISIGFGNGLASKRLQAMIWINYLIHRRKYASLDLNEYIRRKYTCWDRLDNMEPLSAVNWLCSICIYYDWDSK